MVWEITWGIWQIFTRQHKILKIGTFIGSFYTKKKMYELKTYRGVMHYDNEEWCKIWNRTDLLLWNWLEEFNKFWAEHSKISNFCTLMGWFWPKYIMFLLKRYRGVMFDYTQDWYKVWRKTAWCFQKLTRGIWQIFTRALWKSLNLDPDGILMSKVENVWA